MVGYVFPANWMFSRAWASILTWAARLPSVIGSVIVLADGRFRSRKDANARFRGDYVHTIGDGKQKKRSRKESRHEPGNSYRPKPKPTNASVPHRKKKPPGPSADG